MIQETGVIRRIDRFRPSIFSLTLALPCIAALSKPGQFVHLLIEGLPRVFLRRPFSIAEIDGTNVKLIIKIVGAGTAGLAEYRESQSCDVIGPLGRGFVYNGIETAYLVGGGIGIAPLLMLQDELIKLNKEVHFLLGARTHEEFPLPDEALAGRNVIPCTDDGSFGERGIVSSLFDTHVHDEVPPGARVFSCGPVPMMRETDRICEKYGISHQVSLENRMACGIGVCQGCAMQLSEDGDRNGFRLVCDDGPVFNASDLDWSLIESNG